METSKENIIELIKKKYGERYHDFKWVKEEVAKAAESERAAIIKSINEHISFMYNGTKPYYIDISPGCRQCGGGTWSCLFINGKCNGHCFFCPSEQTSISEPVTNALRFTAPADYIDYLKAFGIKGVSISGGEPLLTLDRTLRFISAIQRSFGNEIYRWLYTNGLLLSREILEKLRDAGLDEIRFNLFAQHYDTEKVKLATKYIDTVTVEIPAIPEDYELLCGLLPKLVDSGVKYLNLHQLRCTTYNYQSFLERGYTFLHGPDATILESELTALKLIKVAADSGLRLPVNYCSFVYRDNFQSRRARLRSANCMAKPYEEITGTGIIRNLSIKLSKEEAERITATIRDNGEPESSIYYDSGSSRLHFTRCAFKYIDKKKPIILSYHDSTIIESASYRNMFKEIRLNKKKSIFAERWRVFSEIELGEEDVMIFRGRYLEESHRDRPLPDSEKWLKINSMEALHEGLQSYW